MSVLIKGMKMPHSCSDCNFYNPDYCMQNNIGHRECALVELPKKHGRLIDADALGDKMSGKWTVYDYQALGAMPTIVEAEDEDG